ncbi:MAG: hypothetical protein ACK4OK_08510, partial [Thermoflexus sp.]
MHNASIRRFRRGLTGIAFLLISLGLIGGMALAGWRMGWAHGAAERERRIRATVDAAIQQAMGMLEEGQDER